MQFLPPDPDDWNPPIAYKDHALLPLDHPSYMIKACFTKTFILARRLFGRGVYTREYGNIIEDRTYNIAALFSLLLLFH